MKTKFIPAIVMLTAGLIYGIISMSLNVEMFLFTKELLLVLIIFYVIGTIIRGVLDAGLKTKDDSSGEEGANESLEDTVESQDEAEMENIDTEENGEAKEKIL